jgi:hypothetical protein
MGKASSAKKVARAARAGGSKKSRRKLASFPVVIGLVVALGVGLVAYAKTSSNVGSAGKKPPQANEDHWHAAYGLYLCDYFSEPLSDEGEDKNGIHTHADNLIHIHPFTAAAGGRNAKMKVFFDQTGLQVSEDRIKLPDGRVFKSGETKCNGKPAEVKVMHWKDARTAPTAEKADDEIDGDFGNVRFTEDLGAYTIAFVAKDAKVPAPPEAQDICEKAVADAGGEPAGECGLGGAEIPTGEGELPAEGEIPAEGQDPTATTVPGDTTVPGSDTTAPAGSDTSAPAATDTTAPASE